MCIFTFTLNNLNWNVIIMGSISIFFQWIQIKWKSWARTKLPNFHSFPLLFFLLGSYNRSVAPETIRPSGLCVRVNGTGVKRQRESGAGSWVKGGADPGGARGVVVAVQIAGGGGWFVFGDGPGFNRDVRRDKDETDRPGERSCCDRAATFCIPWSALPTDVTLLYPSLPLH